MDFDDDTLSVKEQQRLARNRRDNIDFINLLALEFGIAPVAREMRGCPLIKGGDPVAPPLYPHALDMKVRKEPEIDLSGLLNPKKSANKQLEKWNRIISEVLQENYESLVNNKFTPAQLWSIRKPHYLCQIRYEIWFRAKHEINWSLCEIARRSGDCDHTTVRAGIIRFIERSDNKKAASMAQ